MTKSVQLLILLCITVTQLFAQREQPKAPWIAYPSGNNQTYGVYHFRKVVAFEQVPEKLVIHVSADNRYNLFVNGKRVGYGPAKGDLRTYKYDVIDIAPFLKQGENILAALVHNAGRDKPMAFLSAQTAFMLRAEEATMNRVETNASWKVFESTAYQPISYYEMIYQNRWFNGYYACGPGDNVDASAYPWGWETVSFDDSAWQMAEELSFEANAPWPLMARNIPFMDNHPEKPVRIRRVENVAATDGFLEGKKTIAIAANTNASVLLDYVYFTMGYPELTVNGGKGSTIQIRYAEALYKERDLKAHRDSVNALTMFGVWDIFRPDGQTRTFRPLWKRAFRYVQLVVETKDEPLEIVSFNSEYSGYPYQAMATFESDNTRLNQVFKMCQRTLRLCSGETYYDTPYYEQLNYGGDNLPIGNISMYNTTDDRLLREAMRLYSQSANRETGLFKAFYPSRFDRDMGSWSLAWIQSLHDYYFLRGDKEYVSKFVENIESVLDFYHRHIDESLGLLGPIHSWNFMDWSITRGSIPRENEKREVDHSVMLTLFYVHTLDCVAALFEELELKDKAGIWAAEAASIKKAVKEHAWDAERKLFRDHPAQQIYSQHTNVLAILTDVIPADEQRALMERLLAYKQFDEYVSSFFSFFLYRAMQKTGQGELYLKNIDHWYKFLDKGLTTAGETGFASHDRSDCHAWSAHPAYFLLSLVCGIQPAEVGFNTVKISPSPGDLKYLKATMPHPKGPIAVDYQIKKGKLTATIVLPEGVTGEWQYGGKQVSLKSGLNKIK